MKPFIYLIQSTTGAPYPAISHPACDRLVLNRRESAIHDALSGGTISVPQASWSEGRNRLLWAALRQARTTGNDYLYYIFIDDACILQEDQELAKRLDVSLTGNPFRTFENFLLEWQPAVGSVRHDRHHYDKGQAVSLGHAPDGLCSAFHRETLSFLLPYYTGFDSESWLYSHHIANLMADLLYHSHRIRSNLVIATRTRRPEYGPRKKYWEIPTTFFATALKPELRRVLHSQKAGDGLPGQERPRKKY